MAYSHSQIQLYKKCPMQYRFNKIDKLWTYETNIHFLLGGVTHEILEYIYNFRRNLKTPQKEDILIFADKCWQDASEQFVQEKLKSWDETNYEQILIDAKSRIDIYIQRYWDTYYPFDQSITDSVEKNISCDIAKDIKFTGIIDRMDISGMVWLDGTPQNTMTIVDYKTNKSLPTNDNDSIYDQLNIYALSIQQKYAGKFSKIIWKVIYLHLQTEYTREITPQIVEDTKSKYLTNINNIEHDRFSYQMWDKDAFACNVSYHCDSCPFQRICPARKHKYDWDIEINDDKIWETTIKSMIDKVWELSTNKKDAEELRQSYTDSLKVFVKNSDYQKYIYGNIYKLSIRPTVSYKVLDQEKLFAKLAEDNLLDIVTKIEIDKKSLEAAIKLWNIDLLQYQNLLQKENGLSIWRPKKIDNYDEE